MPIIVKTGTVTPPPVIPPPPALPRLGPALAMTWRAPDSTEVPLTRRELGWRLLVKGLKGLGAPATEITADPLADGGELVLNTWTGHRLILLPIRIGGSTPQQFDDRFDQLADWFGQTADLGPGTLEVARPGGRRRQIRAYLQDGFDDDARGTGHVAATVLVTLYCPTAWFADVEPIEVPWRYSGGGARFLGTVGGRRYPALSPGRALGDTTAVNPGKVPSYGLWTLTGPAATLTATSARLGGATFTLDLPRAILAGEQVTIDTDPLVSAVTGPAGEDWTGSLNWPGADLWPLMPGTNKISLVVTGSGVGTAVSLAFAPLYRSA
ncbi:phage tail protein [Micromonospora aurantiaca]|uniref:phage tail protein n=1 Tax=Micromonospora aurantiaca (nom. illeg.) TaxID=47850 RepID=UPI00343EF61E